MNKIGIKRVIEFSDFFLDEEPLDIPSVLKTFSRDRLVRMATLLSLQYGNMLFLIVNILYFLVIVKSMKIF